MKNYRKKVLGVLMSLLMAGTASAADINVTSNITSSVLWETGNKYHLRDVIYVEPGATLTIEPGVTVVGYTAAELGQADSSALVVTRGAEIYAQGTASDPIVFTSLHDINAGNIWRPVNSEWGNLTILGDAIIADGTNCSAIADGTCEDNMEGLGVSSSSLYGGSDDDHSIGEISYVSLRYGGSVLGLANELNGLSAGGIGRESKLDHIEIMNNVDDGIEIWGGTSQWKYVSIWNIGDDSFDLDEGFRGKAQFGLIVQGYSTMSGTQGSGIGDNLFEMDGGEHPDNMQPWANPQVYNFTVIGQPVGGDDGLAFRDNMRLQVGNSIFMDVGANLVSFDGGVYDADMRAAFLSTAHDTYDATGVSLPIGSIATMSDLYNDSRSGNWSWIKDSILKNYVNGTDATAVNVFDASNRNINNPAASPIVSLVRNSSAGQPLNMELVTSIDPRAANDAVSANGNTAPADGFFTPADYIGAFSPSNNWLCGWTAADEYGFVDGCSANPGDPTDESIQMTATTTFQSVADVHYAVESSTDGVSWVPVATIVGDGNVVAYTDLDAFEASKLYRAIAL